ncbi:MAG: permease prefix domain 1-containing protein [Chloroflexota bacterium]|nr:permease prefix domain 1-containing protein [Chloroflexota bacterium]
MNTTDRYLNEVCWAMGGSLAEQQAARDELRDHIDDAVREMQLEGIDSADALRHALDDLGDASVVGRAMRTSRGSVALSSPLAQPAGALVLERRRDVHVPGRGLLLALGASAIASAAVGVAFLWPG